MKRLPMRKIKEALRLRANGLTLREISESLGLGRTTVGDHLQRATRAGLAWPLDDALTDAAIDALLFPPPSGVAAMITQPDWAAIHLEYKRPNVTLMLLWEEYRAVHPDGYLPGASMVIGFYFNEPEAKLMVEKSANSRMCAMLAALASLE